MKLLFNSFNSVVKKSALASGWLLAVGSELVAKTTPLVWPITNNIHRLAHDNITPSGLMVWMIHPGYNNATPSGLMGWMIHPGYNNATPTGLITNHMQNFQKPKSKNQSPKTKDQRPKTKNQIAPHIEPETFFPYFCEGVMKIGLSFQ